MRLISTSAALRSLFRPHPSARFPPRRSLYIQFPVSRTTIISQTARQSSHSSTTMSAIESAKRAAAREAVANHYPQNAKFVGIGSGSTIVYVVEAIKELGVDTSATSFVPTGYQSNQLIVSNGLTAIQFDSLPENVVLDVAFDGADEVDDDLNCIKGGGACLYQEKLVALQAKEFVVVADYRKKQSRLLTGWPTIPIEVEPLAVRRVLAQLKTLGSPAPLLRVSPAVRALPAESGGQPIKTDQDLFLVDAPFPQLLIPSDLESPQDGAGKDGVWEVLKLAHAIKHITGVLDVGLFCGPTGPEVQALGGVGGQKPVAAYFGMEDGSVSVRKVKSA